MCRVLDTGKVLLAAPAFVPGRVPLKSFGPKGCRVCKVTELNLGHSG